MRKIATMAFAVLLFIACGVSDSVPDLEDPTGDSSTDTMDGLPDPGSDLPGGDPEFTPTPLESGLDLSGIVGNVRLYLTDAPIDLDEVWVDISSVTISHGTAGTGGWQTLSDEARTLDLLSLQNDVTAVLGDATLEPAYYGQIRFLVTEAHAVTDGISEPLTIPSGTQTGIKLNLDFTVEPDVTYALVLDFDALESIRRTGRGLQMTPVIKLQYIGEVNEDGSVTPLVDNSGDVPDEPDDTPDDEPTDTPDDTPADEPTDEPTEPDDTPADEPTEP